MFSPKYNDVNEVLDLIERIIDIIKNLFGGLLGNAFGGGEENEAESE